MPSLFGVDIASEINQAMGQGLLPVTLTKATTGTRTTGSLTSGTVPSTDDYTGRGFLSDYKDRQINGTSVLTGDRKVSILGASLPTGIVPAAADKVTIEGSTFNIVNVKRDPAAAMYTCQVRGPNNV